MLTKGTLLMAWMISPSVMSSTNITLAHCDAVGRRHPCHQQSRNLAHARVVIAAWADDYNTERPHSALDYQTPVDYARTLTTAIARPAARDESSARRAIAQPAPIGVNTKLAPVAAG